MHTRNQIVTVFGGTGFVGRYIVQKLARAGLMVRVAVRHPEEGLFLKTMGEVGQIQLVRASLLDPASIEKALESAVYAINCVGILFEKGTQTFSNIHIFGPQRIAEIAARIGVKRLIHVSSLRANLKDPSRYLKSKAQGENAVLKAFPQAIIIRPSIIFGPEDAFVNRLAEVAFWLRVLPLVGGGKTKIQPVYVNDVAAAITTALLAPETLRPSGRCILELGGPEIFTVHDLIQKMLTAMHLKSILIPIPYTLAKICAFITQLFFKRILTVDQVKILQKDNIVTPGCLGFEDLGLTPCSLSDWLPTLLSRFLATQRTRPFSTVS